MVCESTILFCIIKYYLEHVKKTGLESATNTQKALTLNLNEQGKKLYE